MKLSVAVIILLVSLCSVTGRPWRRPWSPRPIGPRLNRLSVWLPTLDRVLCLMLVGGLNDDLIIDVTIVRKNDKTTKFQVTGEDFQNCLKDTTIDLNRCGPDQLVDDDFLSCLEHRAVTEVPDVIETTASEAGDLTVTSSSELSTDDTSTEGSPTEGTTPTERATPTDTTQTDTPATGTSQAEGISTAKGTEADEVTSADVSQPEVSSDKSANDTVSTIDPEPEL